MLQVVAREANERQVSILLFGPSEFSRKEKTKVEAGGREKKSKGDEKLAKPQGGLQKASLRLKVGDATRRLRSPGGSFATIPRSW
jgi:hypothetical protein